MKKIILPLLFFTITNFIYSQEETFTAKDGTTITVSDFVNDNSKVPNYFIGFGLVDLQTTMFAFSGDYIKKDLFKVSATLPFFGSPYTEVMGTFYLKNFEQTKQRKIFLKAESYTTGAGANETTHTTKYYTKKPVSRNFSYGINAGFGSFLDDNANFFFFGLSRLSYQNVNYKTRDIHFGRPFTRNLSFDFFYVSGNRLNTQNGGLITDFTTDKCFGNRFTYSGRNARVNKHFSVKGNIGWYMVLFTPDGFNFKFLPTIGGSLGFSPKKGN